MKRPIDITLSEIHVGECHNVVTLGIEGKDHADAFLRKLEKDDSNRFKSIKTRIRTVADYETYQNDVTFSNVGDGIFEFKRPGLRLYAFYDWFDGIGALILCTNGGSKNTKKEQGQDIARARQLRKRYFEAKADPHTNFTFRTQS